jgi:hypothetical protein
MVIDLHRTATEDDNYDMARYRVRYSFPANLDNSFERSFTVPDLPNEADRGLARAREQASLWFDSVRPAHIHLWRTDYEEIV